MTGTLTAADADRLAKLLGLLGSDHAGERDAAGLAAHRFVRERGLTWYDVINPPAPAETTSRPGATNWRETIAELLRQPGSLRQWEADFLRSLAGFPRISAKQRTILTGIAERVFGTVAA